MASKHYDYHDWQCWTVLLLFFSCWLLIAREWKQLPLGRTVAALLGSCFVVLLDIVTEREALQSLSSDTLLLLIGLMLILGQLESKGLIRWLEQLLLAGEPSARTLLMRVSFMSAAMGATLMNDGAAIFLSGVLVAICEEHDLSIEPFAIALATSANIGSAATVIGNPKNMILQDKIPNAPGFLDFVLKMGPPALLGTLINTACLLWYYRPLLEARKLCVRPSEEERAKHHHHHHHRPSRVSIVGAGDTPPTPNEELLIPFAPTAEHYDTLDVLPVPTIDRPALQQQQQNDSLSSASLSPYHSGENAEGEEESDSDESLDAMERRLMGVLSLDTDDDEEAGEGAGSRLMSDSSDSDSDIQSGVDSDGLPGNRTPANTFESHTFPRLHTSHINSAYDMRSDDGHNEEDLMDNETTRLLSRARRPSQARYSASYQPTQSQFPTDEFESSFPDNNASWVCGPIWPASVAESADHYGEVMGPGAEISVDPTLRPTASPRPRLRRHSTGGTNRRLLDTIRPTPNASDIMLHVGGDDYGEIDDTPHRTPSVGDDEARHIRLSLTTDYEERPMEWPTLPGRRPSLYSTLPSETLPDTFPLRYSRIYARTRQWRVFLKHCRRWLRRGRRFWRQYIAPHFEDVVIAVILVLMYSGFIARFPLGFTCLCASLLLLSLSVHKRNVTLALVEHINYPLLAYLSGIFILMAAVQRTPLSRDLRRLFRPLLTSQHRSVAGFGLVLLTCLLSLVFTSIPAVLLLTHPMPVIGEEGTAVWLLAWSAMLCGNWIPFGSVAGLVVSEMCRAHCYAAPGRGRWIGNLEVWWGFAWWSTLLVLLCGTTVLLLTTS